MSSFYRYLRWIVADAGGSIPNGMLGQRLREQGRWPPFPDPVMRLSDFIRDHCHEHTELVDTRRGLCAQSFDFEDDACSDEEEGEDEDDDDEEDCDEDDNDGDDEDGDYYDEDGEEGEEDDEDGSYYDDEGDGETRRGSRASDGLSVQRERSQRSFKAIAYAVK
jgi:hypothetical protein